MSTTLYHGEPNGPSLTVLAALFEKSVDAHLVAIDLTKAERHQLAVARQPELAMGVEGEGPVLVVNGEALTDSVFVACYLDDIGHGTALRPADPYERWSMMAWCRQIIERTAPAAAYLGCKAYPPRAFPAALDAIESVDLRARWDAAVAGHSHAEKIADSENKIIQTVAKIEARLNGRDWLMGDFSIADLESYAWLAGMTELVPAAFEAAPRTQAWMDRVKARPAVQKALALASVAAPERCWAPGPEINRWG